jgi:hypothetical protein
MLEELGDLEFSMFSDLANLRLEAIQLLEDGLNSGDVSGVMRFIERQLGQEPPSLLLLTELTSDFYQRLDMLHEHHADVRERVVRVLREDYGVDITCLAPPIALDQYHHLSADEILWLVRESADVEEDLPLLACVIQASLDKAAELQRKIELADQVLRLLDDWLDGISATVARRYGSLLAGKTHLDLWH